jgi:hypothetical protein
MSLPVEYALANHFDHPKAVYLREADVLGRINDWLAEYDAEISQYRESFKAGGGPAVVGPWIAETQAKKVAAQAEIRAATGQRQMTPDDIAAIVAALGDLARSPRRRSRRQDRDLHPTWAHAHLPARQATGGGRH